MNDSSINSFLCDGKNSPEGLTVLSLFDGMSCGQIALDLQGIKVKQYFASELKSHAIETTMINYPNTIQLGDVTKIDWNKLPKIDLLIGGSPCQDFSRANMERKGLDGEKSGLFYKYQEALEVLKPTYFLLENVIMDDFGYEYISQATKTYPVRINSQRVSGQLRDRLYWTNIGPANFDLFGFRYCAIPQPPDKKIMLADILTSGYTDRKKSRALLESDSRPLRDQVRMLHRYIETGMTTIVFEDKNILKQFNKKRQGWNKYKEDGTMIDLPENCVRYFNQREMERLQTVPEGYTSHLKRNDAACLLGDGWTVDVIRHIFSYLPDKAKGGEKKTINTGIRHDYTNEAQK